MEAGILTGADPNDERALCLAFRKMGIQKAVVTLGSQGALLFTGDSALKFPGLPCQAVDTTGAGDCFNAALAVALIEGRTLSDAVVYAINASAVSVTRPHVMTALPTADEVCAAFVPASPFEIVL